MNIVFRSSSVFFALFVLHLASAAPRCLSNLGTGINPFDCQRATDALFNAAMQDISPREQDQQREFVVYSTRPDTRMPRGKTVGTCAIAVEIDRSRSDRATASWRYLRGRMEQLINACVLYTGGTGGTNIGAGFSFVVVNPAVKDIAGTCMAPNPVPHLDVTNDMLSSDSNRRPAGQNATVFGADAASAAGALQAPGAVSDPARQEVPMFKRPPSGQGLLYWPPGDWRSVVEGVWLWRHGAWKRFKPELADADWEAAGKWMLVKGIGGPGSVFPTAMPSIPLRPHQPPPSEPLAWLSIRGRWNAVQWVVPPTGQWMSTGLYCLLKIGSLGSQDPLVNGPPQASVPSADMGTSSSGGQSSGIGPSTPLRQPGEVGQLSGGSPPRSPVQGIRTSPATPPISTSPLPESRLPPLDEELPWPNIFDK